MVIDMFQGVLVLYRARIAIIHQFIKKTNFHRWENVPSIILSEIPNALKHVYKY